MGMQVKLQEKVYPSPILLIFNIFLKVGDIMRDPNCTVRSYELEAPPVSIEMREIPEYNLYDFDLNDEKSFKKYIQTVEKVVRSSFEYKEMIKYLRENMDMNQCAFYKNVNNTDNTKVRIEIHHEPLSLYDICLIVYNKRVAYNEPLDEEYVAKEVMYHHYNLMVGLIPLAETVHELVHASYLFVPTTAVLGKYKEFVNAYQPYMLPEQLETLEHIEEATKVYNSDDAKAILSTNYIYVDLSGAYEMPKTEDIINMLKGRIKEIVDQNGM